MRTVLCTLIGFLFVMSSNVALAIDVTATIKQVQINGTTNPVGSDYTTIHLNTNITNSNCSSTNANDRLAIENKEQLVAALSAVSSGNQVRIVGTDTCNNASIESIRVLFIKN